MSLFPSTTKRTKIKAPLPPDIVREIQETSSSANRKAPSPTLILLSSFPCSPRLARSLVYDSSKGEVLLDQPPILECR
ncbi:hypothetical protein TNIN_219421 [Trichonephila inaurata madagascariensis]|uniref:Uncharacterized protein n=1 Tax=Trichonephila inaurata madagascariensis TaxID=2747483 RepID=A0A8X6YRA0_9ARAC|nr:hypothetical protein TNIN_219421 [Trichonephila inaurata madagascariensis]